MSKWNPKIQGVKSFTLVEMIASVTIIVVVATMLAVYVGNIVKDSTNTSDRQTLVVLNDALTRFKCGGGDINALTSGAPIKNVLAKLQQPMNWAGLNHQFLQNAQTYLGRSLDSKGENQQYHFTRYNSYMAETGGSSPTGIPPAFVQGKYATSETPVSQVQIAYNSPQTAGNLNIIVVGSEQTVTSVQSVSDNRGNTYSLAIGPITGDDASGGGPRQSIYYASNIAGGATTVTVDFTGSTEYTDIRILEYSGVSTLDVVSQAKGFGNTSGNVADSGYVTTTAPNELLFGASISLVAVTEIGETLNGNGFYNRILTDFDALAQDRIVNSIGSYHATAQLFPNPSPGAWVMQIATFK